MAYRRRQGITRASTFKEEIYHPPDHSTFNSVSSSPPSSSSSLAAQAIRASVAHRDSSLPANGHLRSKSFAAYNENASSNSELKSGFWGVLARKAKAILEEDNVAHQDETPATNRSLPVNASTDSLEPCLSSDNSRKLENPTIRKGLDAITSSLNQLGDTFEKAFEEGRTMVENRTADIIQETRKLQIRRKGSNSEGPYQAPLLNNSGHQLTMQSTEPQIGTIHENQLKASRDVAMATAAKAKLLLRELKTIKADLAFAKERCTQLEEENKILRESREKGVNRADDDLIRLQLETLLAEKARLAHENSIYARENRFLREIVEYHQLTMQDVVYLDEGTEEVTEVYPISSPGITRMLSVSPRSPTSPPSASAFCVSPQAANENLVAPAHPEQGEDVKDSDAAPISTTLVSGEEGTERAPLSSS